MTTIAQYLSEHGPSRSSLIVEALVAAGASPEAARQRVARVAKPIRRFPVPMLPKREAFLYLDKDRNSERFWQNFIRDMRATNSVFAASVDGMIARGGLIRADQFASISGATVIPQRGQLPVETVASEIDPASPSPTRRSWRRSSPGQAFAWTAGSGTGKETTGSRAHRN